MVILLGSAELLALAELLPGPPATPDPGVLDAAVARQASQRLGRDVYRDVPAKAAVLAITLVGLQALGDRHLSRAFAHLCARHLLAVNGMGLTMAPGTAVRLLADAEVGALDVRTLAEHFHSHAQVLYTMRLAESPPVAQSAGVPGGGPCRT